MASLVSQLVEEVTVHGKVTVSWMRERYAQTVLTFRITYVPYHHLLLIGYEQKY